MRLFNNPKGVVFAILAVLGLFFLYAVYNKADAAEAELGPTFTGEFNGGLGLSYMERVHPKIDVGVTLISDQDWNDRVTHNNGNVWAAFVQERPDGWTRWLPSEMSIGAAAWINTDDRLIGCHLGYQLGVKYRFTKALSVGIRHWSNAGTCKPNRGQDVLTFGWRF